MALAMNYRSTVHFLTSFSTTSAFDPETLDATLADITTLGFAISFMTSASVALADCFLIFFLPVVLNPFDQQSHENQAWACDPAGAGGRIHWFIGK
jgi:hypothetical protein